MAIKQQTLAIRDWQYGMVSSVNNFLLPDNYPKLLINCYTDESNNNRLGDVKGVLGYTRIGNQITKGKDTLGLYSFLKADQSFDRLIKVENELGDLVARTYYNNSGTWTEIGSSSTPVSFTPNKKVRFTSFLDMVFAVNGVEAPRTWDGETTTGWITENVAGAPKGDLIINYQDRIHIMSNSEGTGPGSVIWSSSVVDISVTPNVITWNGEKLPVNPDDNDIATGWIIDAGRLVIFKKRSAYIWDGQTLQTDALIDIGAISQESIVKLKGQIFHFAEVYGSAGIFVFNSGSSQEISRPIRKWIDAIDPTNYENIVGFVTEDHVHYSIGDVTVDGEDYTNVILKYCVSKGSWSIRITADEIKYGAVRIEADGSRSIVVGDDNGQVHTWNSGNTDNGTAIHSKFRTKELEFGSRYLRTSLQDFAAYSDEPQGASLRVRVDKNKWEDIGSLMNPVETYKSLNLKGYFFEFEVSFVNEGIDPFIFSGFEFYDNKVEPYAR